MPRSSRRHLARRLSGVEIPVADGVPREASVETKDAMAVLIMGLLPAALFYSAAVRRGSSLASLMDSFVRSTWVPRNASEDRLVRAHLSAAVLLVLMVVAVFVVGWSMGFPEKIGGR